MKYRRLGRTNLKVSVIGLGGGALNPNKDPNLTLDEAKEVISYAVKNGVNFIDTGKEYGEKFISKAMGKEKDKLCISTKSEAKTKKEMLDDIKDSLKKLEVEKIDIYQMHMVESIEDLDKRIKQGVLDALKKAKSEGLIRFIGIFSHKIEVLIKAVKTGYFDVVLVLYNVGHRKAEELFDYTREHDVGVIVAAPFGGGVLIDPKFNETANPKAKYMTSENALKFILSNKNVSTVIPGSRTLKEAKENIAAGNKDLNLSIEERGKIYERIKKFLGEDFCRGCRYCEPCDIYKPLAISEILKSEILYKKYGYKIRPKIEYSELKVKGNKCVKCGKCLPKCPYNLPISERILKTHKTLTITNSDLREWAEGDIKNCNTDKLKQKFIEHYTLLFKNKVEIEEIKNKILQTKKELLAKDREIMDKDRMICNKDGALRDKEKALREVNENLRINEDELKNVNINLKDGKNELKEVNKKLVIKEKELYDIYNSKMYRYVVSNVCKIYEKTRELLHKK